jgi:hypothetical protein
MDLVAEVSSRRRMWPWVSAIAVVLGGAAVAVWFGHRCAPRDEQLEVSAERRAVVDAKLARWRDGAGALATRLAALPKLDELRVGRPCAIDIAGALLVDANDVDDARRRVAAPIATIARRELRTDLAVALAEHLLDRCVLAVRVETERTPDVVAGSDGKPQLVSGWRVGDAYVLAPDGTIRCAARFDARSSDGLGDRLHGDRAEVARDLAIDLERNTDAAIARELRRVE